MNFRKNNFKIALIITFTMLFQMFQPIFSGLTLANEIDQDEVVNDEVLNDEVLESDNLKDSQENDKSEKTEEIKSQKINETDDLIKKNTEEKKEASEEKNKEISEIKNEKTEKSKMKKQDSNPKDLGNIFTDVKISLNDKEIESGEQIEIKDKDRLSLEFFWELSDDVDLVEGDYSEIKIPDELNIIKDEKGEVKDANDTVIGYYFISEKDRTLKLEFNDELSSSEGRSGSVWADFELDLDKFEENTNQNIEFDLNPKKDFEIKIKPKNGSDIKKSGKADKAINATEIIWELDINTSLKSIENVEINDNIPEGLKLTNLEVYELVVGYNGELTEGKKLEEFNKFPLKLGTINKAYRVKYKTTIEDESYDSFDNEATLKGTNVNEKDSATIKTPSGSLIDKFDGTPNKNLNAEEITWKIQLNKSEMSINDAKVKDIIEKGLSLKEDSIKIYTLDIDSGGNISKGKEIKISEDKISYDKDTGEMIIKLGNINSAYQIEYITEIEYGDTSEEYGKEFEFKNKADLVGSKDGQDEVLASDSSKSTVKRGSIIEKNGSPIIKPNSKKIDWKIEINKAEDVLYDVWVEDKFGEGLELIEDSIKIKDKSNTELEKGKDYTVEKPGDNGNDFKIIFTGDDERKIDSSYTIEYSTKITDYNKVNYKNNAQISWGKTGEGIGEGNREYKKLEKDVTAKIENKYSKSFKDINYKEKTMTWNINIGFYKGKTENLTIDDTFPNSGLVFLEESLKITHKVKGNDDKILEKDKDYTVAKLEDNYGKGFKIVFNPIFEDSELNIEYKTSFDPNHEDIIENIYKKYINKADISGKNTYKDKPETIKKVVKAEKDIEDIAFNNGKKEGKLDLKKREISWEIYINYMSKDLKGKEFIVTDTLTEGQRFLKDSFKIKPYSIDESGKITVGDSTLNSSEYHLEDTVNGFKVIFKDGVDKPYVLEFNSKVEGISKDVYKNEAEITGGNKVKSEVKYPKHDQFLSKKAANIENNRVWIGDEIEWKITINDSLSDIKEGSIVKDQIGEGLVYLKDSLKIYKEDGTLLEQKFYEFKEPENEVNNGKGTTLSIKFTKNIKEKYTIKYTTVVVSKIEKTNNDASFTGDEVVGKTEEKIEINVEQSSSGGSGGGRAKKGSLIIKKVNDKNEAITSEAEFEIYYMLNGDKVLVEDQTHKTQNGEIKISGLTFRKYYIKELKAPNGFEFNIDDSPIEIDVKREAKSDNSGAYIKEIKNNNIKTNIMGIKKWINGPEEKPTIELQLYRNGEAFGKPVKLENGELTYTWEDLNLTDNAGKDYRYTVDEVNVPENYAKTNSEDGLTVTNTYVSPKTEITGTKEWIFGDSNNAGYYRRESREKDLIDGPEVKPTIELQLYRNGEAFGEPVKLENGELTYTWKDLDLTDKYGKEYIYTVDEVNVPENYIKTNSEDGLTVTNTYVSPKIEITGTKEWINGPEVKPTIELQLYRNGEAFGKSVKLENGELTYTWKDLDLTDKYTNKYIYTIDEVNVPENYIKTNSEDRLTVINTYVIPKTEITGTKEWVDGSENKPVIELQLYRNGETFGKSVKLENGELTYTWKDLDLTDKHGKEYVYTVDEVNVPENYVKTNSEDGLTVTNTYVSPKTEITGTKEWIDGPENKPVVELQLYRNGEVFRKPIKLENGELTYTWKDLDLTDKYGKEYIYTVDEVNVPENYIKTNSEDRLTVINTYVIPKTEITGTKEWVDGPENKPVVELQLYRNGEIFGKSVKLENGELTYIWKDLDLTDKYGKEYIYTVDEVNVPENYVKTNSEDGLTVTNTYVSPKTEITGTKEWINGPEVKPTIELQLYRNGEAFGKSVKLENGELTYTWKDLDLTDNKGKEYKYTIDEITDIPNYGKSISKDKLTITNTYNSPLTDIIARKVWVGGPDIKPTVELQLYRNGEIFGESVTLENGVFEHVWKNLDITDKYGKEYIYTVDEVNAPENYIKTNSEDGLTIINTYVSPKTEITGIKKWIGGPKNKPLIELQLYRDGKTFGEPIKLENGELTYTWKDLDLTDKYGKEYIYTVDEVNVPENYTKTNTEDGLTIINTYEEPEEPIKPGEPSLPATGTQATIIFTMLGIMIILAGVSMYFLEVKRKNKTK